MRGRSRCATLRRPCFRRCSPPAQDLPQDVGAAIDDGRTLLEELQVRGKAAADTLRRILYTLRHFPLYHAVSRVDDHLGGLQVWLQPEDLTTNAK